MANSIGKLSRGLYRLILPSKTASISLPFCTSNAPASDLNLDVEGPAIRLCADSDFRSKQQSESEQSYSKSTSQRMIYDRPLENGLDVGVYKAILVGMVGMTPLQKKLRTGRMVTLLSVGTGGIRNNRRPFENEKPMEYANRCSVQWHRVSIYQEKLGETISARIKAGSIIYVEGNLETKIFSDPMTGLVRRVREVAIRQAGRLVFLGMGEDQQENLGELKGVGYY